MLTIEHNGLKYRIRFQHLKFQKEPASATTRRGEKPIQALTYCDILQWAANADPRKVNKIVLRVGRARCRDIDQFSKRFAQELSFRRAVAGIEERALRGKLLAAFYQHFRSTGRVREINGTIHVRHDVEAA